MEMGSKFVIIKLIALISIVCAVCIHLYHSNLSEMNQTMPRSSELVVPNIIHFIRFGDNPLTFIDAVCILAALKHQRPERLIIHSDQKDFNGGKYWHVVTTHSLASGVLEVKYLEQPDTIYGKKFNAAFKKWHASDVERLRILMKYGGIYLDNDCYVVDNLDIFRRYEMTLGWQENGGISDQVIIAAPDARFLRVWLQSYKDYRGNSWFYNGGELPTELLKRQPYLVHRVKKGLAEYRTIPTLLYLHDSELWKLHYVIHLLINHMNILPRNLSHTATYPVVFNETNIFNYDVTIKQMVLDVYPFEENEQKKRKHILFKNLKFENKSE